MLTLCPAGRCLLHHKGIENGRTMFFQHVTAGNVNFVACTKSMTNFSSPAQPLNFLYETRLNRGNAISEILQAYSMLENFYLVQQNMGRYSI